MNILVVNDDGINAPGIKALVEGLSKVANVYVSAPATQQSGRSQSLSVKNDIYVEEVEFSNAERAFKVTGTPADCTKFGLRTLKKEGIEIDMVYTGINMGSNLGKDTLYSGTVGAAMEAALDGYHSVAVSVDSHEADCFEYAVEMAINIIDKVFNKIPTSVVLNLNTPNLPKENIRGIKITRLGGRYYDDEFVQVGCGQYGIKPSDPNIASAEEGTDIRANAMNYASITPLTFDYTDYSSIKNIEEWDF